MPQAALPQAALPQSPLPSLDRVPMATVVAGVGPAKAAQNPIRSESEAHSGTMEFADFFEILSAFDAPQERMSRLDMPEFPALAGNPRQRAEQAVSAVTSSTKDTSETVKLPAKAGAGQSPDEAKPLIHIPTDVVPEQPARALMQNAQATHVTADSVLSDDESADIPAFRSKSDTVSDSFVPRPQPDVSVRRVLAVPHTGTEPAAERKGAVGDIFSVIPRQVFHPQQPIDSGVRRDGVVAHMNGADTPKASLSAASPHIPAVNLSGRMPQSPPIRLEHPQTAGTTPTEAEVTDKTSGDTRMPASPPVAMSPQEYDPTPELYQKIAARPASEVAPAKVSEISVDQPPAAITIPPSDRTMATPAADPAEILPVAGNAIRRETVAKHVAHVSLPRLPWPPIGLGSPAVDQIAPGPARASVTLERETSEIPSTKTMADPHRPEPNNLAAVPINLSTNVKEGGSLRPTPVRPDPVPHTRLDHIRPERFSPDVAESTVMAGADYRPMRQSEHAVVYHAQREMQNDDSAAERLRNSPVHETRPIAVSEYRAPSPTAAFTAPTYPTTLQPTVLHAREKSPFEQLADTPLMTELSVTARPVEDLQIITRPVVGPSSELIRQVFHNALLPSHRIKEGPVEIRLSPQELGHVRINISMAEGAIAMSIHAERSETLELLRRNIEQLSQEFRQIGYGNISFSFGQNTRQNEGRHKDMAINRGIANAGADNPQELRVRPDIRGPGVDLRV